MTALGTGCAGGKNRLGNICGPLERAADKDSRASRLHRIDRSGLAESVGIEFDAELARQSLGVGRRIQSNGQYHHIEFLFLDAVIGRGISYGDILGFGILFDYGCVTSDKPNPWQSLRSLVESLKILAIGTNIVMEYRTLCLGVMIFC